MKISGYVKCLVMPEKLHQVSTNGGFINTLHVVDRCFQDYTKVFQNKFGSMPSAEDSNITKTDKTLYKKMSPS